MWVVLYVPTSELHLMPDAQAVQATINMTWSRVPGPVVETSQNAITVKGQEGQVLVIAKGMRDIPYHTHGTHL